jgi:uncharacterized protein YfkK (UPF0435 family)
VGTMAIKNDYIKVRVSTEQKELFKNIAKKKKVSMSEFIIVATEQRALREKEKFEGTENLDIRVTEVEKKLQELKAKMERQRGKKTVFFKKLLKQFFKKKNYQPYIN